jgi:mycothiol synthase
MLASVPILPTEYSWRTGQPDGATLRALLDACDQWGGTASGSTGTYGVMAAALERVLGSQTGSVAATDLACIEDVDGAVVGVAWARVPPVVRHQYRGLVFGAVHPEHRGRGIGRALLVWAEARGRELLAALPDDRRKFLRIEFEGRREDAARLYERCGFGLQQVELTMNRALAAEMPETTLPLGLTLLRWTAERAPLFYETWRDAFSDRPGTPPGWTIEEWATGFAGGDHFRADLSWVVVVSGPKSAVHVGNGTGRASAGVRGAGYIMCEVHTERCDEQSVQALGIRQVGVRPAWRGLGLGSALIGRTLRTAQAEGVEHATLEVNVNNPGAKRLYEKFGFREAGSYTVYSKE